MKTRGLTKGLTIAFGIILGVAVAAYGLLVLAVRASFHLDFPPDFATILESDLKVLGAQFSVIRRDSVEKRIEKWKSNPQKFRAAASRHTSRRYS